MGPHKGIEFADFDVYKAWQFFKYNVGGDPLFEVETLMNTHRINSGMSLFRATPTTRAGHNLPLTRKLVSQLGS